MTRFRVLVGYEFEATDELAAYARVTKYVTEYNEAAERRGSPLRLVVGPPGPATVTVLAGELTAAERARVVTADAQRL